MFAEIGLLVLEGDAAGLAAKVSELSAMHVEGQRDGSGRRSGVRDALRDGAHGAPAALIHSQDS